MRKGGSTKAPESVERKVHLVDLPHSVLEIFCLSRFGIASFSFHTELHQSFQIASQVAIHKSRITSAINRLIDKQDIAPGLPDGTEVQSSSRIRPFHITEKGKRDLTIVLRALGIKLIADN